MNETCPKHGVPLKTWPSGDQYCPHLDSTGREAKNGKKYCTYILKADRSGPAVAAETVKGEMATPAVQSARFENQDARVAAVMVFAGRVFQGQGADQAINALEFAKMALALYE